MVTFNVFDLFRKRALITRESAQELGRALKPLVKPHEAELILDFAGVDAVTPSFVDEVLFVTKDLLDPREHKPRVVFRHPPTRLSAKFAAIARAHEAEIAETEDGEWIIS